MRLLSKIAGVVLIGIVVLLAIDAYLSVRREVALFDRDMANDGILIGRTLRPLALEAWSAGGNEAAASVIMEANRQRSEIDIRWVRLDEGVSASNSPRAPLSLLDGLGDTGELSIKDKERNGYRYTYVSVPVADGRAAIEISEPLSILYSYTRTTILRKALLVAALVLISVLILWALGVRFIGVPLAQLVEKTHRVGAGDFSGDVPVAGSDELGHLAQAMNDMCRQLDAASRAVRRETEARMEALEQLRHSERLAMLGRLSSNIAHELGTPLNVVAGRANLIATEELPREAVVTYSRTIEEQARRMTDIIRQLLGFARRRSESREMSDVTGLAAQIIDLLATTARKAGVEIELDRTDDVPEVKVARSRIQQVLMNLMMNGIHAMPQGGRLRVLVGTARSRHHSVDAGPERDYVTVAVEDDGVGLRAEEIERIFDPFFTTKESGKGTGLGLSIASGIVEEHDGWIDVASEPGGGSRFTVYLPTERY